MNNKGLEPLTLRFGIERSTTELIVLLKIGDEKGIEPLTTRIQTEDSTTELPIREKFKILERGDSNPQPERFTSEHIVATIHVAWKARVRGR